MNPVALLTPTYGRDLELCALYGNFVENDAGFSARHTPAPRTQCVSYRDDPKPSCDELKQLLRRASKDDVAFSVASFSTPVQAIRAVIEENRVAPTHGAAIEPARLAALC